jgi:hypothetical protein
MTNELTEVIRHLSESSLHGDKEIIAVLKKSVDLQVTMINKIESIEKDFDRALKDVRDFARATKNNAVQQSLINEELRAQVDTLKAQLDALLHVNQDKVQ